MRPRIRAAGALLAATVLVAPSVLVGTAGPAAAAPGGTPARSAPTTTFAPTATRPVTVTLVTGDKVTVLGPDRATVRRGKGRTDVTFMTSRADGHLRVIPSDALPMLAAGTLDARLFDITTLLSFGYDDRRDNLPLIVTGPPGGTAARATTSGIISTRAVPGGTALHAAKAELGSVWQSLSAGVRAAGAARTGAAPAKIWLDGLRKPTLKESVPQIGAPTAWAAGFDGSGVKVAVVDSGVDSTHPDLAGRVAAAQNFTTVDSDTLDRVGHGTHVAATIGSTGAAPGGYKGVAPGASLLSAKVCVDYGCEESWMLAGMQWAAEQGAKVINMSIGGGDTPEQDPIEAAVERITDEFGALFVISAGNDGFFGDETVSSPGSTDSALTVGAVDKSDNLADFSSRGPRIGDGAIKPDITAPGVDIVAAQSKDGFIGTPVGDSHVMLSGTSMASPHVAGSAAILAQEHPNWTPAQLKAALMASAKPRDGVGVYAQGAGRVDVARGITQTVFTDPPSVSFGRQLWPHGDDKPDARTVTYRNTGTADVTLSLSLAGNLPAGLFSLSASTLTVPAAGTASVTLTSDTRANVPDARHGGHLVATAGDQRVVTPFAVDKEVESYDVQVRRIDQAGAPTGAGAAFLVDQASGRGFDIFSPEPTVTVRVPKGTYSAVGFIEQGEFPDIKIALVVDATVVVDRALTVTLDARKAKPVSITVPKSDAAGVLADVGVEVRSDGGSSSFSVGGNDFTGVTVGQTDPKERNDRVSGTISSQLVKGPLPEEGPLEPSPYAYFLTYGTAGQVPTGFTKRVTDRDVATVNTTYATQGVPTADTGTFGIYNDAPFASSAITPVTLPGSRVDYYSTAPGVEWVRDVIEGGFEDMQTWLSSPRTAFAPRTYQERRNFAVFGPGFLAGGYGIARLGNDMQVASSMFSPAGDWVGDSATATGRTVVERNGQVIFDQPQIGAFLTGVAAEDSAYRVRIEATRGAPNTLSTTVTGEWTYRSGTVPGDTPRNLAASAVRFAPPLTDRNTAPAGKVWLVPVEVQRQSDSAAGRARTLTVEVSFDDGATWRAVPVLRFGQHALVAVHNPAAGFVSFRAASADAAGNTVKLTVIRGYAVG